MRNLEEQIKLLGLERLVFTTDLYKERYSAKYLAWPVVRHLYTRTVVLNVINCLIGSHEVSSTFM